MSARTETEYRVYYKLLRDKPPQNRRAYTFAWGRNEDEAIAKIRQHHGRIEVTSIEVVRAVQR